MSKFVNIEDLRRGAQKRLPKIFFDYIDGGAFSETTMQRNRSDFTQWELQQRVLRTTEPPQLSCHFLGQDHSLPFMLGPVGFLGLYRGKGEIKAAQAAKNHNIPLCLSTFSISSIGTLQDKVGGKLQFQLYMDRDKSFVEYLLQAAEDANVDVLHLTVDTSVTSVREKDSRNGFRAVTKLNASLLFSMMQKPAWCWDMFKTGAPHVEAVSNYPEFGSGALEHAGALSKRLDPSLTWDDVKWLRTKWKKKLVVKGLLSAEDAKIAQSCGADAIVISNHGGRQLDFASSTIAKLPSIRKAVGPAYCVMIDGGFRRGSEIVMALGLGASGVMLGRAYAFGLAAKGQEGVEKSISILADEISITLKLMGLESITELQETGAACVLRRL
jgi:isopentenyl diphosphate isomerase/L-lactate dehydrogenase-like FMN-dependent dehydrogenase